MIGLNMVLRFGRWMAAPRPVVNTGLYPTKKSNSFTPGRIQATIVGSGAVVMLAVVAVTAFRVVPLAVPSASVAPSIQVSPTPKLVTPVSSQLIYRAAVPGPGCDEGSAHWALVPPDANVQCDSAGLQVAVNPNASVVLEFIPPGPTIPEDYQVSARVDLTDLPSGCAGIISRVSNEGFYEDDICHDGRWFIFLNTGSSQLIGQGTAQPQAAYTITVKVQGSNLTLSINDITMSHISDTTLRISDSINVSLNNLGDAAGVVVVGNFIYRPVL
jgi:hypothetical protein